MKHYPTDRQISCRSQSLRGGAGNEVFEAFSCFRRTHQSFRLNSVRNVFIHLCLHSFPPQTLKAELVCDSNYVKNNKYRSDLDSVSTFLNCVVQDERLSCNQMVMVREARTRHNIIIAQAEAESAKERSIIVCLFLSLFVYLSVYM